MKSQHDCPLCLRQNPKYIATHQSRDYFQCSECDVISVPPHQHLNNEMEKAIYDHHENDPKDERYRKFLSQVVDPLLERLRPSSKGLDFGCGPGPTLSIMLEEAGHDVEIYDPYYFSDSNKLNGIYDFITMTEVVEHLNGPRQEFQSIKRMLKMGSLLAIMTKFIPMDIEFKKWSYINDPTHIVLYNQKSMHWLNSFLECEIIFLQNNITIFKKN